MPRTLPLLMIAAFVLASLAAAPRPGTATPDSAAAVVALAPAVSVSLLAIQDSWLDESLPFTPNGLSSFMQVGQATVNGVPALAYGLVQFDVSIIPYNAVIDSAQLRLFQTGPSQGASLTVYADTVLAAWNEVYVVWGSPPAAVFQGLPPVVLDAAPGYKSWDVTALVAGWAAGTQPNYGVQLRGDPGVFAMRQFATLGSGQPEPLLDVQYHIPPTMTPTASRTATPTGTMTSTPTTVPNTPTGTMTSTPTSIPSTSTVTPTSTPTKALLERVYLPLIRR